MTGSQFVIVSAGRSGSGWIARVLTAAGIPTGHEAMYHPGGFTARPDLAGDSSWLAIPHLPLDVTVFHQLRHPLRVVSSWAVAPFGRGLDTPYTRVQRDIVGESTGDRLTDVCKLVAVANEKAASASVGWWRVEDFGVDDLLAVASVVGVYVEPADAAEAIRSVPTDVNARPSPSLAWADIPDSQWKKLLVVLTVSAGYEVDP